MKVSKIALSVALALVGGAAHAGGFNVSKDITVNGDLSAGAYYVVNHGGMGAEAIEVTDFGLAFSAPAAKTGDVGFKGVIGSRNGRTILDTSPDGSFAWGDDIVLDFGYATYKPVDNVTLDIGWILTTVGNEASPSIFSANVNRGFMWNAQPAAYEGARVSYAMGDTTLSGEVNHNTGGPGNPIDFALAVSGKASGVSYSATYYDGKDNRNIIDLVVNTEVAGTAVGANFDYFMLDNAATGQDDTATGFGLYVTPKMGMITVPVRIEFVSDGTSGIYTVPGGTIATKGAYSLTVTPTMKLSDNTFVRAELSYVGADEKVFKDKDGKATDTQTMLAFQLGYTF